MKCIYCVQRYIVLRLNDCNRNRTFNYHDVGNVSHVNIDHINGYFKGVIHVLDHRVYREWTSNEGIHKAIASCLGCDYTIEYLDGKTIIITPDGCRRWLRLTTTSNQLYLLKL